MVDGGVSRPSSSEMQPLVPAILLGMARGDSFEADAKPEPPHGQFAQPVQRVRGGEGDAVIRADRLGQAIFLKGTLEDGEGVAFLGR